MIYYTEIFPILEKFRAKIIEALKSYVYIDDNTFIEIIPLQYTLSDFVCFSLKADRQSLGNLLTRWACQYIQTQKKEAAVYKRIDFYGEVIHGHSVRGNWLCYT